MVDLSSIKYCQTCGANLVKKYDRDKERPYCEICTSFIYVDPKVAVVALVACGTSILLIKREIEPHFGKWSLPSGYVDRGESVENALIREVFEETTICSIPSHYLGVFSGKGPVVVHVYVTTPKSGTANAGDEVSEVKWCDFDEIPELPFPYDSEIISEFRNYLNTI
tara:strand:+ start:1687 stop:2187 length:501 start_codon:yes stop_codon:yes gene_type:complete